MASICIEGASDSGHVAWSRQRGGSQHYPRHDSTRGIPNAGLSDADTGQLVVVGSVLDVKAEVHDVAVLKDVVLAFEAPLAGFFCSGLAT